MRKITTFGFGLLAGMIIAAFVTSVSAVDKGTYHWGYVVHTLTNDERDLVERVVAAEARGESYECMVAVAQTIRERREHWGGSIDRIVKYPQYAKPYKGKISAEVKSAVSAVFDDGVRAFEGYTTHFHDDSIKPPTWAKNKVLRGEYDGVSFYGAEVNKNG